MSLLRELPLHPTLLRAVDKLAFTEATPVQVRAIPAILDGKDLMASARTGSGKTAAFLLPILDRLLAIKVPYGSTRALILVPTRELALQTEKHLQALAKFTPIKGGVIIGGEAYKHQVATLRKNPEILIATPGRLVDHIEKGNTDFTDLEFLVLDEADRMLDMGFAIDMNTISSQCRAERQNLLFSATLNHKGLRGVSEGFSKPEKVEIESHGQAHENIQQQLILADDIKHKEKLTVALIAQPEISKVFIFCNTRVQCEQVSHYLRYKKVKSGYIHGEIEQNQRKQILNSFRQGSLDVLVATDLAARGLDIRDVDLVINFTVAQSGDDHTHRIGRTGRAGKAGRAVTLVSEREWNQMSSIERYLKMRFEPLTLEGLKANYKGPKKLKKSGKAAGSKKKKKPTSSSRGKAKKGKPSKDYGAAPPSRDGYDVLRKK